MTATMRDIAEVVGTTIVRAPVEIMPFIKMFAKLMNLSEIVSITCKKELTSDPNAFGVYDADAQSIIVGMEPHIYELTKPIIDREPLKISLRGYWIMGLMVTIVHEWIHSQGKSHPDGKDTFSTETYNIIQQVCMAGDVAPVAWSPATEELLASIFEGEETNDEFLNLKKMEKEGLWYYDGGTGRATNEFMELMRIMSPDPHNKGWTNKISTPEKTAPKPPTATMEEKKMPPPPPKASRIVEEKKMPPPPPPKPAPVYEDMDEDGDNVHYDDEGEESYTPSTPSYQPKQPTDSSISSIGIDWYNKFNPILIRLFAHMYSKCGIQNGQFTNLEGILEPVYVGDLEANDMVQTFSTGATGGGGKVNYATNTGSISGLILTDAKLPSYKLSVVTPEGCYREWSLIAQNPNKMDSQGNLTKGAVMAREGKNMLWIYRGKEVIGLVKNEVGVGFVVSWDPYNKGVI